MTATTESADLRYHDIDSWATRDAVAAMLDGQQRAVEAVRSEVGMIADAAEAAAARLAAGRGRLIYVGAGTSGRIAVQDGVELAPTFGWPADRLETIMAGGAKALLRSAEGAEDDAGLARREIEQRRLGPADVVIGVAASGRTPFTIAAIVAARASGALTIAVANNADSDLTAAADFGICAATGAEVLAGSTRMQAGTAQKVILNLLSTAIMIRLGRVYRGLMIDMIISNQKLLGRAHAIVADIAGCTPEAAVRAVAAADNDIKLAILIALGRTRASGQALLAAHGHILRDAIAAAPDSPR